MKKYFGQWIAEAQDDSTLLVRILKVRNNLELYSRFEQVSYEVEL